jgi:hypothetical protein
MIIKHESGDKLTKMFGRIILDIYLMKTEPFDDGAVIVQLDGYGGTKHKYAIFDDARSCCEDRYITSDTDFSHFIGAEFSGLDIGDYRSSDMGYDTHDCQFLNIRTSKGVIVCETHDVHNGYYGGFSIRVERVEDES